MPSGWGETKATIQCVENGPYMVKGSAVSKRRQGRIDCDHGGHVLVPLRRFQEQAVLRRHAYPEWVPVRQERAGVDAIRGAS